jgi:hypothetical protein
MIRRRGPIKVISVATNTLCRQSKSIELPNSSDLVAGIAIYDGMSADQRKAILMAVNVLERNLPAIRVMTELALGPVLSAMEVGVTVLALIRHAGELQAGVAVTTPHVSMLTSEGKARIRMIEPDLRWDNLPARRDMTRVAGDVDSSVRAASGCGGMRNLRSPNTHG